MGQKQQRLRKRHTSVLWVKNIWVYMFQFIRCVTISGLETENGNPLHLFAMYVSTMVVWCFIMWLLERQEGSELHIPMGFINPFSAVEVENKLQALDTWHPSYMLGTSGDHTLLTAEAATLTCLTFLGRAGYVGELMHSWSLLLPIKLFPLIQNFNHTTVNSMFNNNNSFYWPNLWLQKS